MFKNYMNENEKEIREIVKKYENTTEKEINHEDKSKWSYKKNEIFYVTDRYGFIHNFTLPTKLDEYERISRSVEASRAYKWVKMLANWRNYYPTGKIETLRQRVYKGIPNQTRGIAWCRLLGALELKKEYSGRYSEMLKFGLLHSKFIVQIDKDVNRAFRNNVMFKQRYSIKQRELFRVLIAYSVYNSELGYCQGMSELTALLLMYMTEENAFWCLHQLMTCYKYSMHGFFIPGFPKFFRFSRHHNLVLKKYLPAVHKHFQESQVDLTLYNLKWFFQCFLNYVPFSLTLRLWDLFILEGEVILTCMSYTILKLHEETVLNKGMEDLSAFFQLELEKQFGYDDDQAITALRHSISELRRTKMELPREAPKKDERPTVPFGHLLNIYNHTEIFKHDERLTVAENTDQTSLIGSEDLIELDKLLYDIEVNDFCTMLRSLSLYDNINVCDSSEAAKTLCRLSYTDANNSRFITSNNAMKNASHVFKTPQSNEVCETEQIKLLNSFSISTSEEINFIDDSD